MFYQYLRNDQESTRTVFNGVESRTVFNGVKNGVQWNQKRCSMKSRMAFNRAKAIKDEFHLKKRYYAQQGLPLLGRFHQRAEQVLDRGLKTLILLLDVVVRNCSRG